MLTGVVKLPLGSREILVYPGLSTMTPRTMQPLEAAAELRILLDRAGEEAHRHGEIGRGRNHCH